MDLSMNYIDKAFTSKNLFLEKINRPNAASLQDNRGLGGTASTGWRFSCEEWEARDEWDQPAVVWSLPCDGRTPPPLFTHSISSALSVPKVFLSTEQKEAPTGDTTFSVTHEMMRTTQLHAKAPYAAIVHNHILPPIPKIRKLF